MSAIVSTRHGFSLAQYAICLKGIVWRESLRFLHQRERFVAALVRPPKRILAYAMGIAAMFLCFQRVAAFFV